jgi:plasmid stability protein
MRITIDVPKALCQRLKAKAAREQRSIEEVVARIVVSTLRSRRPEEGYCVTLPLIASRRPSSLKIDNNKIYSLISFP